MQDSKSSALRLFSRRSKPADNQYIDMARRLLAIAGIEVDGNRPWDIRVQNEEFYPRILAQGSLGLGESYMEGWWECERLDEFICRLLQAGVDEQIKRRWLLLAGAIKAKLLNLQSRARSARSVVRHYDIGNDLFEIMLDRRMIYSCAYWQDARTLDEAQEAKLDLVCRKVGLRPGQKVLDIGCGWGGFAAFAAERYGAQVVAITISPEQAALASEKCKGLPVEIRLQDYRALNEEFDHIVSIGMFEHVGYKNYRNFLQVAHRSLKPEGLFLLHTIGGNTSVRSINEWINKYIFPNSMLPSIAQIGAAVEGLFVMEDWHVLSTNYDRTLMAWHENFKRNWEHIKSHYSERFRRMWEFYLLSCAGSFRARVNQLWQIVLSKNGVPGGYVAVR